MKSNIVFDNYHNTVAVSQRKKDITSVELNEMQEKKEFIQALTSVSIGFIALLSFAIWASNNVGNTY